MLQRLDRRQSTFPVVVARTHETPNILHIATAAQLLQIGSKAVGEFRRDGPRVPGKRIVDDQRAHDGPPLTRLEKSCYTASPPNVDLPQGTVSESRTIIGA